MRELRPMNRGKRKISFFSSLRPISSHLDRTNLINKGFIICLSGNCFLAGHGNFSRAARWKTRGRGTGSRGVENTGSGEYGVWWKTQRLLDYTGSKWTTWGPSGKHGIPFFSPTIPFFLAIILRIPD